MEDKILSMLLDRNEISWKTMIFDLVKQEGMDPWDVDVGKLTDMYIKSIKDLKQSDLSLSGKVVLAAALLVKFKSKRLVGEDVEEFDRIMASGQAQDEFYDSLESDLAAGELRELRAQDYTPERYELNPHTPQPRKRKVSVYDLVKALEKALEVKQRRLNRIPMPHMKLPENKFNITAAIKGVYERLLHAVVSLRSSRVKFSSLLPGKKRTDKVFTFVPLLHLSNQQKVILEQEKPFSEIMVTVQESDGGENNDADKRREKVSA